MKSATANKGRRMSLPPLTRQRVTPAHSTTLSSEQRRRGSVCMTPLINILLLQSSTDDDDDDDDDTASAAAVDDAVLSEMYNCRNLLSQLLTAVSQLKVTHTAAAATLFFFFFCYTISLFDT